MELRVTACSVGLEDEQKADLVWQCQPEVYMKAYLSMLLAHHKIFIDSVLTSFATLCNQASCLSDITFFWLCQSFFTLQSSHLLIAVTIPPTYQSFHYEVYSRPRARRLYRCRYVVLTAWHMSNSDLR